MKILNCIFFVLSSFSFVMADIPPLPKEENKPTESGICAGALLFVVAIVVLGSWLLRNRRVKADE